jgi:hypothetical protein
MNLKDLVTLTLAFLAFAVSAGTAYFNIVRKSVDVRVVTNSSPVVVLDDKGHLGVWGEPQIQFINSGNRDIAVTSVVAVFFKSSTAPTSSSDCISVANASPVSFLLNYEFKPFVVTPGDIVIKTFDSVSFADLWKSDSTDSHLIKYSLPSTYFSKDDFVFSCLRLSITTPDMVTENIYVPKHYVQIQGFPHTAFSSLNYLSDSNKPHSVLTMHGLSFGD